MNRLLQLPLWHFAPCGCSRRLPLAVWRFTPVAPVKRLCPTSGRHASEVTWALQNRTFRGSPGSEEREPAYSQIEPGKEEEFVFLDHYAPEAKELPERLRFNQAIQENEAENSSRRPQAEKHRVTLQHQLRVLEGMAARSAMESAVDFHDVGFPTEHVVKSEKKKHKRPHKVFGTPDAEVPVSDVCCSGCGALMHCTVPDLPGYLPSEKYKSLLEEDRLKASTCQRCFLITHHQKALDITMSKEEYRDIVRQVKSQKALVLLIVDLLDMPDSVVPDLPELVGRNKHVVVLGNKVDLLPGDGANYLQRVRRQLVQHCAEAGITGTDPKDVHLISAKTGYGVEHLISTLQSSWRYKGDVYLVGTTNSGKSTLFNTLLESDYCKSRAADAIHKATISPWPGTTLNLLKFPIINPTPYRMLRRMERLKHAEEELSPEELKRIRHLSKQGYLVGSVGRTFRTKTAGRNLVEFDPGSLSIGEDLEEDHSRKWAKEPTPEVELTHNELKDARWFYDTPGIMKEKDILSLLTESEVKMVLPTLAITPRTFILQPGMVLFLGALARFDYLEGSHSCWFSVLASSRVPVHITSLEKANAIYEKHAGDILLGVPAGGVERMKDFPPLLPQDFNLIGQGQNTAICDIKLSSAGWVSVTAMEGDHVHVRGHAPEAAGMCVRAPPLLPHIATVRGERVRKSPVYTPKKPQALVNAKLSEQTANKLKVKRK
ncbi:nitric oxide-associated protein 1 [Denticeps clupeoides]|uniref:Nitric oxide associated 1 n=1 Tax=Denticeps clupeoides TaxID=299321 RepID=A0AAY4C9N5_9TELE|nr:nitric oxide-associated protein 1 [Denticeps clupeoides]